MTENLQSVELTEQELFFIYISLIDERDTTERQFKKLGGITSDQDLTYLKNKLSFLASALRKIEDKKLSQC